MQYSLIKKYEEFKNKINEWVTSNISKEDKYISQEKFEDLKLNHLYGFHSPKPFGGMAKDFLYYVIAINEIAKVNELISISLIKNYAIERTKIVHGNNYDFKEILNNFDINKEVSNTFLVNSHLGISSHNLAILEKSFDQIDSENEIYSIFSSELEAAKLLIYKAAELKSNGIKSKKESAQAKLFTNYLLKKYNNQLCKDVDLSLLKLFNTNFENIDSIIKNDFTKNNQKDSLIDPQSNKVSNVLDRLRIIFDSKNSETNVIKLVEALKDDLYPCFNEDYDIYKDIEDSDIVVSFGLGIGDRENIDSVENLCRVICGSIACTLPIAEELEWMPIDRLIGINGKSFNGHIYLALGLSGAKQHVDTINSDIIIAINEDKHAPIFSNCDYGIIGDVNEILPILIKKLKNN